MTQYDAYLPYGELLVDEHSSSEEMPYKFNGKELDEETGLYYYGARYMNPVTSMWYGVDPLCEKYYNVSPYVYCHNNPVIYIDPDGRKDYHVNSNGDFYEQTSLWLRFLQAIGWADKNDRIFVEGADEPIAEFAEGTIKNLKNNKESTTFEIENQDDANKVYDILTDLDQVGCSVEWAKIDHGKNGKISSLFKTDHERRSVAVGVVTSMFERNGESITMTHNHSLLLWTDYPDNYALNNVDQIANPSSVRTGAKNGGDIEFARDHPKVTFILKDQVNNKKKYYNGNGVYKIE